MKSRLFSLVLDDFYNSSNYLCINILIKFYMSLGQAKPEGEAEDGEGEEAQN